MSVSLHEWHLMNFLFPFFFLLIVNTRRNYVISLLVKHVKVFFFALSTISSYNENHNLYFTVHYTSTNWSSSNINHWHTMLDQLQPVVNKSMPRNQAHTFPTECVSFVSVDSAPHSHPESPCDCRRHVQQRAQENDPFERIDTPHTFRISTYSKIVYLSTVIGWQQIERVIRFILSYLTLSESFSKAIQHEVFRLCDANDRCRKTLEL